MLTVRSFDELATEEWVLAGGKGGTLARLYQAGHPVPDGFVILPNAFDHDELKPEAWGQVQKHLSHMRGGRDTAVFAVRSSALSEDSAQASFAGEFETVLSLRTDAEIREAIHAVRRSRLSERVAAYSQAKGMDATHEIAVVVQRMVQADISGVLFTADPVTGSHMRMVGNFVHGSGEQLVAGEANAETFTLERPKGTYDGPPELARSARKLYKLASRLEQEMGCQQDIEWAIADGRIFLLQSRPITTLIGYDPATGEWNDSLTGDFLWSNVNVGEGVPDVMTPFTWNVLRAYWQEWVLIPGYHYLGNIGGRAYTNASVPASIYNAMGKSRQEILELIEGLGFFRLPEEMDIPLLPLSKSFLISIIPRALSMQIREKKEVKSLPAYLAANPAWCEKMHRQIKTAKIKAELVALWRDEIKPQGIRGFWETVMTALHHANYTIPLRRELIGLVGADDADALLSSLSSDSELLASLGLVVGVWKVARGQMSREEYLNQYGHRGPYEFELAAPRPAEDTDWLDRQLREFSRSPVDVEALLASQSAAFEAAWGRFLERYPRKGNAIRRRIDRVAPRARMREAARSEYVRTGGVVRAWALRAGELTGLGDDIFFLTPDEVLDLLADDDAVTKYIPARRETYKNLRALPPYPAVINGRFDPYQWAADPNRHGDIFDSHAPVPVSASDAIVGSAGSAGRVEGVVRRLDSLEEGDRLQQGEILVTAQTNIGWTLLFPRAAAIITDVGASLSHAAIVARELGIPAVVGCGDATMRLHTGDRVLVDGSQGIVEILETV
jgi:phosphohistidine swiveling domain-containing protein